MLEIGAIRKSSSPWVSAVVLVKSGLCFCIDLQKLNVQTTKDAYTLLKIEQTLDCVNEACIFNPLDLKSWLMAGGARWKQ